MASLIIKKRNRNWHIKHLSLCRHICSFAYECMSVDYGNMHSCLHAYVCITCMVCTDACIFIVLHVLAKYSTPLNTRAPQTVQHSKQPLTNFVNIQFFHHQSINITITALWQRDMHRCRTFQHHLIWHGEQAKSRHRVWHHTAVVCHRDRRAVAV